MKKGLKQTIFETVSTFRNLFVKLKDRRNVKSIAISELEERVTKRRVKLEECRVKNLKVHGEPSHNLRQIPAGLIARSVALSGEREGKLYSEALWCEKNLKRSKRYVKSTENHTSERIKKLLKSKILVNPTEIKVGINPFKSLKNGKVLIETNSKKKSRHCKKNINAKCEGKLEVNIHKLRKRRLVILIIPEYISTVTLEDTLIAQHSDHTPRFFCLSSTIYELKLIL